MNTAQLAGLTFTIVADSMLPQGKRGYVRALRPARPSDPGRLNHADWQLHGPIGHSRQGPDGFLGVDYAINLDTRYADRLISVGARNTVSLTGFDPLSSGAAVLGGFALGSVALGGGTSLGTPQTIRHIHEDRRRLFVGRGAFETQVDPSDWTVENTINHSASIKGMEVWFNKGYVGCGSQKPIQRRIAITGSGATYEDVQVSATDQHSGQLSVGTDRLWMIDANTDGTNKVKYTLDDFDSISNSFVVGDQHIPGTGIGTMGPLAAAGTETGAFSFTSSGKPVRLLEEIRGHRAQGNCAHIVSKWGWFYIATDLGLFANNGDLVTNPVGIEAMPNFEGPIDGFPTALWPWRDSLFAAYLGTTGDAHIVRGLFGPQTGATGLPEWFPYQTITSTEVRAITSTSVPTNPTIVWGEGSGTLAYQTMGRRGRDIADANYTFSTAGGQWFGTTMMGELHMLKTLRYGRFYTGGCDTSNYWQLAVLVDDGMRDDASAYIDVGHPTITVGMQTVRPTSGEGGPPLGTTYFHMIKPRLTQVSTQTTLEDSPHIHGMLELVWDERPDQIEEVGLVLHVTEHDYEELVKLASDDTKTPVEVMLPNKSKAEYGIIASVGPVEDMKADIQAAAVTIHMWDVA